MGKYDSKRVLHIGCGAFTRPNIRHLKNNGAYLIVADKCDPAQNPYRNLVDEVVKLDIDNTSVVIDYCKANKIDAVFGNGSEESYEQVRIINEGIGNEYCHTAKQWQTFALKDNFRQLCIESGLNTPATYYNGNFNDVTDEIKCGITFPIIVKPVDNCGGIGISVVMDSTELDQAIKHAGENSLSSKIIIEEYVEGKEVVFTYVVQDGIYKLTASADKYVYKDKNNMTCIPDCYMYPCDDHDDFIDNTNDKVLAMLKKQGLNNCTIFFQTIEKDGKFYFFEAGLRFEGTRSTVRTCLFTGQNAFDYYYDYVLKVKTDYDITKEDPKLNGHTLAMFVVNLKKGTIKYIAGKKEIENNDKILLATYGNAIGGRIDDDLIGHCFAAFCIDAGDRKELVQQIRFIKKTLKVRGRFYQNMIVNSFDENILLIK